MIECIGWTPPTRPNEWRIMNHVIKEEKVAEWAEEYPEAIFFFVYLTQDVV